ncbi:sensor histidine kinase [Haloarcula marina]|uniref:sensor histidine kinase n=1 Tax=Haloarcula marina TaxID=2961574 RepID=UPI0020B66487|nr:PAS domain-containing sensor histidine kinase [Halomicroarcula marina]
MFDDLDIGVILRDPETGRTLDVNPRLAELYGYSAAELTEMDVGDYTAPSTTFSQAEAHRRLRAAADGTSQEFEWQVQRGNGELIWVRVHLNATTIDGEQCVLCEVTDITNYRTRERRLRLLSRIVRHNLRNKMTVLNGYADRIRRAVEDDTLETEIETILNIAEDVGGLSDSVRQIEQIAEPDATQRSPTNVQEVVSAAVEEARRAYPEAQLTVDAEADVWVVADEGIRYTIEHALENAIEHNDTDTPTVAVRVTADSDGPQGVIQIADNGQKIPDNEIEVLRGDVKSSSTYHGTGVGLWVMEWCVSSLGGELRFEENDPCGNVVHVSLPRVSPEPEVT